MKNSSPFSDRISLFFFCTLLLLCACYAHAQVSVAIAPDPHPQFLNSLGAPLAGGFLYTYQAGTTTLQNTYVDSTGTVQNADPIPLDASGAPSNGSVQTGIWLANLAYKFCAYNSAMVQQWCTDNVTGYLGLLNLANTWNFTQTFTLPIADTSTDNQMVFGAGGNQTTLDFPPPTGNITLHMPNTADTMVGRATTDTLTNKTLTSPAENTPLVNGVTVQNSPGTYVSVANSNSTGTTVGTLTKLTSAPSLAVIAATTDTGGILGVCVLNCGTTGNATIQQSGSVPCVFDGATTAGDYVSVSSTTAGNCHDAGASSPGGTQNMGRVLSTNGGGGTYSIVLFGPEIKSGPTVICASATNTTASSNTSSPQVISTCGFPSGALNTVGKMFRLTANVQINPIASYTTAGLVGMGTSTALGTNQTFVANTATANPLDTQIIMTCGVTTAGATGNLTCSEVITAVSAAGTITLTPWGNTVPTFSTLNLTGVVYVGTLCSFGTASASNTCVGNPFVVEQLN